MPVILESVPLSETGITDLMVPSWSSLCLVSGAWSVNNIWVFCILWIPWHLLMSFVLIWRELRKTQVQCLRSWIQFSCAPSRCVFTDKYWLCRLCRLGWGASYCSPYLKVLILDEMGWVSENRLKGYALLPSLLKVCYKWACEYLPVSPVGSRVRTWVVLGCGGFYVCWGAAVSMLILFSATQQHAVAFLGA